MKKRILGAMLALFVAGYSYAQETVISSKELPISVKSGVQKYFGGKSIDRVVKDRENGRVVYDIYFSDYTEAEFSSRGELKEAKSNSGLPNSVIPANIRSYIKRNYPNVEVVKWDRSRNKQEVELSNGLDLDFSSTGKFLRVDD